ncbi:helix-turn-helix transcriptional regulator [Streptomyces sp. NBC_01619]|uniref:helix-turn-helix domain-containing protein n=1 Tax=unclassified Streptomyces TaxID=2593676 RepID=UPI002253E4C8|nr:MULTISPECIES: helix-turn-helix transcriptional regulator [unclassified Streptomyces]MCX4512936.1 helix-turn-helix transcriptional regulator [Streptomyces sp. NBC_01619]
MTETWRYCGNQIKLWRTEAGISREELGKEANYEYETVKSMEQGRRKPSVRLLQVADQMCGAQGKLLAAQEFLKPEPFPARSQEYMAIEAEAIALHWYEPLLIPGLLQTEEYARALISESCPPLDDETVDERVSARLQRQDALTRRASTLFSFVLYEASLRTMVGGREAMKRQLQTLLEAAELRNVSVQVLPMGRCSGLALAGSIVLLETPDHEHYAFAEGQTTSALYAEPAKVSELTQRHDMIRRHALCVEDSAGSLRKVAEEL